MPDATAIPFIQAKNYRKTNGRTISLIVLHTMEAAEKPGTAKAVAQWFASKNAPEASAHYCIGDREIYQCVRDIDVAWGAPGTNHNGIQFEHVGYAAQTAIQWDDAYSKAMLEKSAALAAALCRKYRIRAEFVQAEGLLLGEWGITTHQEVTIACGLAQKRRLTTSHFFNKKKDKPLTDHWDPGENFPIGAYMDVVRALLEA